MVELNRVDATNDSESDFLKNLYLARFSDSDVLRKQRLWQILCDDFLQKYISTSDIVLDLGAGYCEFINSIRCLQKHAVDLNPDGLSRAGSDVKTYLIPVTDLSPISDNSMTVVFISNVFEHLKDKEEIVSTLKESMRVLKPGGKLILLQPNIRYAYREYWDFFDHRIPLSHLSLIEVLESLGYAISEVRPKFLPYKTQTLFPKLEFLLKPYLKIRLLQRLFGKQVFLVAKKQKDQS